MINNIHCFDCGCWHLSPTTVALRPGMSLWWRGGIHVSWNKYLRSNGLFSIFGFQNEISKLGRDLFKTWVIKCFKWSVSEKQKIQLHQKYLQKESLGKVGLVMRASPCGGGAWRWGAGNREGCLHIPLSTANCFGREDSPLGINKQFSELIFFKAYKSVEAITPWGSFHGV